MPRISVITIVRNAEKTLENAIKSVISQSYPNLEYIIIDGHSTDNTLNIIKTYQPFLSYWQSQPDRGGNDAYNIGLQHATGDIVTFLNADDWYENNILHDVARLYVEHQQPDIMTCFTKIVEKKNGGTFKVLHNFSDPKKLSLSLANILFSMPLINARFFKRSLFTRIGVFKPIDDKNNYLISADRELLLRACLASVKDVVLNKVGYIYLSHDESQTMTANRDTLIRVLKEHLQICKQYLSESSLPDKEKILIQRWQRNQLRRLILAYMKSFQFKNAFNIVTSLLH